ncbi:flagellar biosynthesis protein FlhB [Vibrio maritimus]|uniref:Flagellar biosynthesis protein FlhB n=1 Tax=Vibrio maritimus TaxID=990268 RepID=A0A090TTV5_9VIBR|nr:flagellar biosynthesis protein FlhB [Vibrio maritimus]
MADKQDSGDKSELPSQHKLTKARREGQIPRAKDFVSSLTLAVVVAYYVLSIDRLGQTLIELFLICYEFDISIIGQFHLLIELVGKALFAMIMLFFLCLSTKSLAPS